MPEYHKLCLVRRIDNIEIVNNNHTLVDVVEGLEWLKYDRSVFLNLSLAAPVRTKPGTGIIGEYLIINRAFQVCRSKSFSNFKILESVKPK
jgi:hypothetical protein